MIARDAGITVSVLFGMLAVCALTRGIPIEAQQRGLATLACEGPFRPDASAASLAAYFGSTNVTDADIDIGEGETEPGTVLFPSSNDRVEVLWMDGGRRMHPRRVIVRQPWAAQS